MSACDNSPAQLRLILCPKRRVTRQALNTIRDRIAVAFEVAFAIRKSIALLAMLSSWGVLVDRSRIRSYGLVEYTQRSLTKRSSAGSILIVNIGSNARPL